MQTPRVGLEESEFNRFRASKLSQVESRNGFRPFRLIAARLRSGRPERPQSRFAALMDKVLLAIEIACALIVAWIAFQYIYTVYFDNSPRRITPSVVPSSSATRVANVTPTVDSKATASPTRFVEVAPPETGGPEDDSGTGTGPGPGVNPSVIATATPFRAPTAIPTPTIELQLLLPSRLRIPVMFLDSPVHDVTVNMGQWEVSPMDIGHHAGTANPGEKGNMVLAGHRDINSALFRELDRLQPGDEVFVSNSFGEYRYVVQESMVVSPDDIEVMDPTTDHRLTLITCTPLGIDTQRLVVIATLDNGSEGQKVNGD